jgi:hypothetical protein
MEELLGSQSILLRLDVEENPTNKYDEQSSLLSCLSFDASQYMRAELKRKDR